MGSIMKETSFIEQNKNKWARFEQNRNKSTADPDELGRLYSEINSDLSYAQTFYKKRTVRAYLNYLAQDIHRKLYKQKKEPFSKVLRAWSVDIPLEIYRARKNILFAFVLFLLYATIGAFSTHQDPDFAKMILGSGYIDVTESNIQEGNPMGIYGSGSQGSMFIRITINNIQVALMCFFGGILFSLGTHVILFNNALMVGVFQYFFKLKGLLLTSFLTIWIHGAFEISAIVIASGAGFTLGHGLLFPGTYTRFQALQMSGMRGVRIMLSLIPVFIIAGFLESYVTRHYQTMSEWSKWFLILFSFGAVIFYYVLYPIWVARKYPELVYSPPKVSSGERQIFDTNKIRSNAEIIKDTFQFYRMNFGKIRKIIFRTAVPVILLIALYQNYVHFSDLDSIYYIDWATQLSILFGNPYSQVFNGWSDIMVSLLWIAPITMIALAVYFVFSNPEENTTEKISYYSYFKKRFFPTMLGLLPIYLIFIFLPFYFQIPFIFILPFLFLHPATMGISEGHKRFSQAFRYGAKHWSAGLIVLMILSLTVFFFAQPFGFVISYLDYRGNPEIPDILDWFTDFVQGVLVDHTSYSMEIINLIRQLVYVLFFLLVLPLFFIASGFVYFTARELIEAKGLKKEFMLFGKRSKTQETYYDYE
ncbi:MAG: stage II sporulation protein M [Brumimicrobium sp.]|nr:stage II sporulation protein M [Brumimicrobium sp.]